LGEVRLEGPGKRAGGSGFEHDEVAPALKWNERKSRFVDPATETKSSATRVLAWSTAVWYSKIRTPCARSAA
jgi:hypothetical protein